MKERRARSATYVAATLAVAIVVACLLAAPSFQASAENISSPVLRSVALEVTRPLASAARSLRVEQAREWIATSFGEQQELVAGDYDSEAWQAAPDIDPETGESAVTEPASGTSASSQAATPSQAAASPGATTPPSATSSPGAATPPSATTSPSNTPGSSVPATAPGSSSGTPPATAKERPTPARPLRVLVAGDSLVLQVGNGVTRLSETLPLKTKVMSKPISGLSRPDFYDWPAVLAKTLDDFRPDVTVLMFGNNDKQDVKVDGKRLERFSAEWMEMYRSRVRSVLRIAQDAGSRVVWVGMPVMRSAKFSETARTFNKIYSEECAVAARAGARTSYVDMYELFSSDGGAYSPYLPNSQGKSVLMRNSDGIHLTEAGGDRSARAIVDVLKEHYELGG